MYGYHPYNIIRAVRSGWAREAVMSKASRRAPPQEDHSLVKVSLNLPVSVLSKVEAMARDTGHNRTTVIRRAIDAEAYFHELRKAGGKVIVERGGKLIEVVFR